jgi:hypothetical protein
MQYTDILYSIQQTTQVTFRCIVLYSFYFSMYQSLIIKTGVKMNQKAI